MNTYAFRPKLKSHLTFSVQAFGGKSQCVLEDPARERYWRVGTREFALIKRLDGTHELAPLLQHVNETLGENPLTIQDVEYLLAWLAQEGLLADVTNRSEAAVAPWYQRLGSTVFYRLKLGNPQPVLKWLDLRCRFLTGWFFFPIWLFVIAAALVMLSDRWLELQSNTLEVIAPHRWLAFLLIWWGLKLIHETSHGLTCLRHGGNVPECGVLFVLCAPIGAYVDVTSAWRFPSKWQRMHVTASGIYAELFVAAIAGIVWSLASDLAIKNLALQTMLLASVATFVFNANPLIRFDGYYLLADWLELPNLYQRGQLALRRLVGGVFFGGGKQRLESGSHFRGLTLGFGVASLVWRYVLCFSIMFAAALLLDGAGLLIAWGLALLWIAVPILQGLYRWGLTAFQAPLRFFRSLVVTGLIAMAAYSLATLVAFPDYLLAPGVVQARTVSTLRSPISGEVTEVLVELGDHVTAGQELLIVSNPETDLEIFKLQQQLAQLDIRRQQLIADNEIGLEHAEARVYEEMREQLAELKSQSSQLIVRAPHSGTVTSISVKDIAGQRINRGGRLLEVADLAQFEFAFSTTQARFRRFTSRESSEATSGLFLSGLAEIELDSRSIRWLPTADFKLESPALAVTGGGSVAEVQVRRDDGRIETRSAEPRVHGVISLPNSNYPALGTTGLIRLTGSRRTVKEVVGERLSILARDFAEKMMAIGPDAGDVF